MYGQNEAAEQINQLTMYSCNLEGGALFSSSFQFHWKKLVFPSKGSAKIWNPALLWVVLFMHPSQLLVWGGPWAKWAFDESSFLGPWNLASLPLKIHHASELWFTFGGRLKLLWKWSQRAVNSCWACPITNMRKKLCPTPGQHNRPQTMGYGWPFYTLGQDTVLRANWQSVSLLIVLVVSISASLGWTEKRLWKDLIMKWRREMEEMPRASVKYSGNCNSRVTQTIRRRRRRSKLPASF